MNEGVEDVFSRQAQTFGGGVADGRARPAGEMLTMREGES
jgi:hypothetical protein